MFLYKVFDLFEEDLFDYQGRQMKEPLTVNFLEYCFDQSLNGWDHIRSDVSIGKFGTSVFYLT